MARALCFAEQERARRFVVEKRRRDWMLGRLAAKRAVRAALAARDGRDVPLRELEIVSAPEGYPVARLAGGEVLPLVVSLSHSEGRAAGAAAWRDMGIAGLGIDIEALEPRSPAFVETFFTPHERAAVEGGDRDLRANAIWCAKEAVLKAFATGLTVDTREVECRLTGRAADIELVPEREAWAEVDVTLAPALRVEGRVSVAWRGLPGFVAALCKVKPRL